MKATHPAFEPAVVGIDVLYVEDTVDDAWAMLDVERSVGNSSGVGKGGINAGAVGAQNRLLIDQRSECRDHVCRVEFFQFEVGGLPAPITHHEY